MSAEVGQLTGAEREALALWDGGIYSCACEDRCPSLPCQNDRNDMFTTVERIICEREAKARAEAWDEGYSAGKNMAHLWGHVDGWEDEPENPYRANQESPR